MPPVNVIYVTMATLLIPYSGQLLREKTFANFAVLWLFAKVFTMKIVFPSIAKVFSLKSFYYMVYIQCIML